MLEVHHIFKTYEGRLLLNDISFKVDVGETVCLLGASGSGKSTLLRIIAGLENPDAGSISFDEVDLTPIPAHLRDFGLVFQDYALFPHLNVEENVAFGLKMRRLPQPEIDQRVAVALETINLSGFELRQVTDLSGGEQQRVALARALAIRPRLLMFDEPLGALDRTLREDLLNELRMILHQTEIPAIYITHDQEEAFTIADRVLILHEGKIICEGTPAQVWASPGSAFVARFLGLGNVFRAEVRESAKNGGWKVESGVGTLIVQCGHKHQVGEKIHLLVRPLPATDSKNEGRPGTVHPLSGIVADVVFQQDYFKVTLDNGVYIHLPEPHEVGERIEVPVKIECLA